MAKAVFDTKAKHAFRRLGGCPANGQDGGTYGKEKGQTSLLSSQRDRRVARHGAVSVRQQLRMERFRRRTRRMQVGRPNDWSGSMSRKSKVLEDLKSSS